ncbi:MAG: mechanosensitive ion channel family protein [Bdellovibrionales bacterium]|nr:mechanosensitive ion channel family protein [Bdellovibrionales bacterium]
MNIISQAIFDIFSGIHWQPLLSGFLVLLLGQLGVRGLQYLLDLVPGDDTNRQKRFLIRKLVIYTTYLFIILLFLRVIGADFKMVLSAAGVLTLAVGFAARTSISNLISGVFLIFERPFVVGDIIEVNNVEGEVVSIDLLSMTIRTLDNLKVRLPNEIVVGHPVKNYSYFPIRRFDMTLYFRYTESLTNIHNLLLKVAKGNEYALEEPEPYFQVKAFKEDSIEVMFAVWSSVEDFYEFQSSFSKEVHRAFKNSGIEQPFHSVEMFHKSHPGAENP